MEPEKTYILRVQKGKEASVTTKTPETKANLTLDEKHLRLIAEFDAVHPHLRGSTSLIKRSSDSDSEMGSNNSISNRQNIGMVVIVYGSATLVYIQLMFLAAFLQTAATPPGLIFLISSLGYVGYIVFMVRYSNFLNNFIKSIPIFR